MNIQVPIPPPKQHATDFTLIYDEKEGFKKVPLDEVQFDEVVSHFDVEKDVRFELFTDKNPSQPQLLMVDNYTTIYQSNFNWRYQTRILIHGW